MIEYGHLKPMEPRSASNPFDSEDYLYQVKWDGVRIVAFIDQKQVRLQNRKLRARSHVYPDFENLSDYIDSKEAILDGEMVVLKDGKPSFSGILKRDLKTDELAIKVAAEKIPATYVVFDLISLNGQDLTTKPLTQRLELLREIAIPHDYFQIIDDFPSGIALFRAIEEQEMEGIVAKKKDSPYLIGQKTDHWLKIKTSKDLIAVVGGYTIKERRLSSLLMGAYLDGDFHYIGNAATGLTSENLKLLSIHLLEFEIKAAPFINPPRLYGVTTHWIQPLLTVKVEFMEWSNDFQMRAPVIRGFTRDNPQECILS